MGIVKKLDWQSKIALLIFLFFVVFYAGIHLLLPQDHYLYRVFGATYGIMALWGGIWGLFISRHWGGLRSLMGRAILAFSIGLFLQEFGQLAYTYYIYVLNIEIPYPSIGDIGFFGTIPFYIYGAYLLAKVAGVKVSLSSYKNKIQAVLIPAVILLAAFILLNTKHYVLDLSDPLTTFLNYGYPLGQAVYISITILTYSLTRGLLGGMMKNKVLLVLFAFFMQFTADYIFIYFSELYYPASFIDLLYLIAYFIMTMGILQMQSAARSIKQK